jgi:DNA repair protein RadA/Sms
MDAVNIDSSRQSFPFFSGEVNRVLGGGLVKGSVVLLAGEPGVGKSTLMLQLAASLVADKHGSVVYISGEESAEQIVSRARRLGLNTQDLFLICDIEADEAIDNILAMSSPPAMVIVDSVQTMLSAAASGSLGSVTQTRECAARFVQLAKATGSAVLLSGHVTKSGEVAGPRVLEHMVDTVLYLEGSERAEFRLLRGIKNRFGGTAEVGVLAMTPGGLEDVANPSELFLSSDVMRDGGNEGSAVAVVMEGSRPLLAEIQCLVSIQAPQAKFNNKRMSDGFPIQRLLLICAVIEKRLRLPLWSRDIYVNVAGGLRVSEPCSDLAVAVTVISSMTGAKIKPGTALIGELGLGGELRGGRGLEQRVAEARKMGFSRVVVPRSAGFKDRSQSQTEHGQGKDVFACRSLRDVLPLVFEDVDDVERLLKPSRRQRKWGRDNYGAEAEAEVEADAEAEAGFDDDDEM